MILIVGVLVIGFIFWIGWAMAAYMVYDANKGRECHCHANVANELTPRGKAHMRGCPMRESVQ